MIFAKQSGKRNKYFFSYTQGFFSKRTITLSYPLTYTLKIIACKL